MDDSLKQYLDLYEQHADLVLNHAPEVLNRHRPHALQRLIMSRLPHKGDEGYEALSVAEMFAPDFGINLSRKEFPLPSSVFQCAVPNISCLLATVVNDVFVPSENLKANLPQGVVMMSLAQAAREMPTVVDRYYGRLSSEAHSAAADLNTLFTQDGVLILIGKGVQVEMPLQLVNIFNAAKPMLAFRRLLFIVEEGAKASILMCDHTDASDIAYLNSQVAEIFLERDAQLEIIDMEESSILTNRHSQSFAALSEGSELKINNTTLLSGITRNATVVNLNGKHASAHLTGLVTGNDTQTVANATRVSHHAEECESNQTYKYLLNGQSIGMFYGTIIVDEGAKFTKAYQSNRNILANTDSKMYTRPQLEIYCDEVKCSHGATVGQLDQNALFYMRSRGIPEAQARVMLMQAFTADVIDSISIPSLRQRLYHLVERRLYGEMDLCSGCSIKQHRD